MGPVGLVEDLGVGAGGLGGGFGVVGGGEVGGEVQEGGGHVVEPGKASFSSAVECEVGVWISTDQLEIPAWTPGRSSRRVLAFAV